MTPALPPKRPRGGKGTWTRHYCDPAVSPKHAKGHVGGSPRTSPERTPRSEDLAFSVVKEIAAVLAPYTRHQEPPSVVADVLLRLLPLPDCARSTIALVVHREGTGSCDNLTYRQAGALGRCDRRTAIIRFARTESYGFIHMEQRDYECGGAAPNLVTTKIPSWVYEQVDDYLAIPAILRPPDKSAAGALVSAGRAQVETTEASPATAEAAAVPGTVPDAVASPSSTTAAAPAASGTAVAEGAVGTETSPSAPALSPEDAAIDARLVEIHAFTSQRFQVASVRGLNAQTYQHKGRAHGVPNLDDADLLAALDEYIARQRPKLERKTKYHERPPRKEGVEHGIHAFLWYKRARLDGLTAKPHLPAERRRRAPAAHRPPRASGPVDLTSAVAPVELGVRLQGYTTIVRSVAEGSLAASMGLQPDDKIMRVDGQAVSTPYELRQVLSNIASGQHAVEILRGGYDTVTTTMTIGPRGPPLA